MKRELFVKVTVIWEDYDDVSNEMMFEDAFDDFCKDGVKIELVEASNDTKRFKIDFFELAFLAESCIPPVPIARQTFWDRLIDEIYDQLNQTQRDRLFEWITANERFDLQNNDCRRFWYKYKLLLQQVKYKVKH